MLSASPVETTSRVSPWSREYSLMAEHVCCWERDSPVTDQEGRETERESLSVDVLLTATCLCSTWLSSRRVGNSRITSSCWELTNMNTKSKYCFDSWNSMCLVAMMKWWLTFIFAILQRVWTHQWAQHLRLVTESIYVLICGHLITSITIAKAASANTSLGVAHYLSRQSLI